VRTKPSRPRSLLTPDAAFTKKYGFNGVGPTRLRTLLAEETDMYAAGELQICQYPFLF
jgi:hypothetical protein